MSWEVLADAAAVAERAADLVASAAATGPVTVVLAGGTTPRRAYEVLRRREVAWGRVTVLFGDERCVPPDSPESNYRMAREALLDHVAPAGVHRIPAELGAEAAVDAYDAVVRAHGPLDLVLLGVGPDGHTASLFPGNRALAATALAAPVHGAPKPPPDRVTLTLPALRAARRVVVLATGADKAAAVAAAREGRVPAGMIEQAEWLLDEAAAAR